MVLVRWIEEIVAAMRGLGGAARYADLYELIELTTDRELTREWKATVRRTVEDHSSDSANFRAEDIFQHVSHGHWALRGVPVDENELAVREKLAPSEVIARVLVREHWRRMPENRPISDFVTLPVSALVLVGAKLDGPELVFEFSNGFVARAPKSWFIDLLGVERGKQPAVVQADQAIWAERMGSLSVASFFGALRKRLETA